MAGGPRGQHWKVHAVYTGGKLTCGARTRTLLWFLVGLVHGSGTWAGRRRGWEVWGKDSARGCVYGESCGEGFPLTVDLKFRRLIGRLFFRSVDLLWLRRGPCLGLVPPHGVMASCGEGLLFCAADPPAASWSPGRLQHQQHQLDGRGGSSGLRQVRCGEAPARGGAAAGSVGGGAGRPGRRRRVRMGVLCAVDLPKT